MAYPFDEQEPQQQLPPEFVPDDEESNFRRWYNNYAVRLRLNPDPDDPRHQYDYRSAWKAGAKPDAQGHWPSQFKLPDHPNRYVNGIDTITGQPAPAGPQLPQRGVSDATGRPVPDRVQRRVIPSQGRRP